MAGALGKLLFAAFIVASAAAALVVLGVNAHYRSNLSHCRNNMRWLGVIAVGNWQRLDPSMTGRAFWQGVKEAQYRDVRGNWKPMNSDPFVCPFTGHASSRSEDAVIDYRGPKVVRENLRDMPAAEPIGADRPGHHPRGGGHVLHLDTSVEEVVPSVDPAGEADVLWRTAARVLGD